MARLALLVALFITTRSFAEPLTPISVELHEARARKLTLAGDIIVAAGALLLVGTAVRAAVPAPSDTNYCGDPCLNHTRVRDMAILSSIATDMLAIGIPLLALGRNERKRARLLLSGRF